MARGRMIANALFRSEKFARVVAAEDGGTWAGLVYVALVTNADVEGRIEVDAGSVLDALARTGREAGVRARDVERCVAALANVGLIRTWTVGTKECGEIVGFHVHNSVRRDREAPSRIPPRSTDGHVRTRAEQGTPGALPDHSRRTPAEGKRSEARGSGTTTARTSPGGLPEDSRSSSSGGTDAEAEPGEPEPGAIARLSRDLAARTGTRSTDRRVLAVARDLAALPRGPEALSDILARPDVSTATGKATLAYLRAAATRRSAELVERGLDADLAAREAAGRSSGPVVPDFDAEAVRRELEGLT